MCACGSPHRVQSNPRAAPWRGKQRNQRLHPVLGAVGGSRTAPWGSMGCNVGQPQPCELSFHRPALPQSSAFTESQICCAQVDYLL